MTKFYKKICSVLAAAVILAAGAPSYAADVIVSGRTAGIKIYTDGIIAASLADFADERGQSVCPAREAGIKPGDVIKTVNGEEILSCEDLSEHCAQCAGGVMNCEILREGERISVDIEPKLSADGLYRIGLWTRDSTAGIGTLTYINPDNMRYAALGHAITDVDTGNIMTVNRGNIQSCHIVSVTPGHIGLPGWVTAEFDAGELGVIDSNAENGISGTLAAAPPDAEAVPIAASSEVKNGEAFVLSDVEGGEVKKYSAQVEIISETGYRNMIIKITDESLLGVTGGIIQGMSGAPIIQDGRLIGAVTHVFINDPRRGYAIFAENLAG